MIQKISFGSTYRIITKNYNTEYAKNSLPLSILSENLNYLYEGNQVSLKRTDNGDYELKVPKYMDCNVESYCIRKGIPYYKV